MSSKFNEDLEVFANRILSTPEETNTQEPEENADNFDDKNNSTIPWVIGAREYSRLPNYPQGITL